MVYNTRSPIRRSNRFHYSPWIRVPWFLEQLLPTGFSVRRVHVGLNWRRKKPGYGPAASATVWQITVNEEMMRETWKGTEAPVVAPAAVVLRAGCRSGDWTRRDWKPASSQPVGQAVVRQQAVTRLDPGNLIGRDILKLFNGRGRNFSFGYQGNGVDIRRLGSMLLTSVTFDRIRFDKLSPPSVTYRDPFIVWSWHDNTSFLFFFCRFSKREDMENYVRISCRCFLNELVDFSNWNLPWRGRASVFALI